MWGLKIDQKSLVSWSVSGVCFWLLGGLGGRLIRERVSEDLRREDGEKN